MMWLAPFMAIAVLLTGCAQPYRGGVGRAPAQAPTVAAGSDRAGSRWTPVDWSDLPGFEDDSLFEAWNAWVKSCERPGLEFVRLCKDVRVLSLASTEQQRAWMRAQLRPYRVEAAPGHSQGLLTGYFEPVLDAARQPGDGYSFPVFAMPAQLAALQKSGKPWYTRQEMDTLPEARLALRERELLWLKSAADVVSLQIQGSGRALVRQADGTQRWLRLSWAGSNNHPYQSPGRWLLEQRAVQDASWPGIKTWLAQNPQRQNELLWSNPRVVFFREEWLNEVDAAFGPNGAQGVALTPGRSIAVDPASIPYGTPVWLVSSGPAARLQKLVLAQDTGSAITGAVRADYFAGWGPGAAELAGRLKQPLQLWVLWPK
jgi:membrane-bound lytic murein transglycosylase A